MRHVVIDGFRRAYEHILRRVWRIMPDLPVVLHGYAYPVPDGRAVLNFPSDFRFFGPWLRPSFARKAVTDPTEAEKIMRTLIDSFNEMAAALAGDARVHYVDLRSTIARTDWVNELHVSNHAYQRIAAAFHETIQSVSQGK